MSETQEAMNKLAVMQAEEIVKLNSRLKEAKEIMQEAIKVVVFEHKMVWGETPVSPKYPVVNLLERLRKWLDGKP